MPMQLATENGKIDIDDQVIAVIAGSAAVDCYGLVGMASRKQLKDGIAELLGRENLARGVEVRREGEQVHLDLHVIVSYGTKISEVAHNIQSKVKYVLEEVVGLKVDYVNIYVQGVRVTR
ncbi:Asp23/Gls24 family envelope stress response protein [Cohnella lubricantis]|uniref:Asp23/Gls24 family envelope stress response protein n=1 Tax=Cohnella lubricantis TaxID=2163172 RepID=A0A841TAY5_9BACL|nr:Asp23/Gls24 family envelope stress response protein [Cohnella lubricantis]MBB6677199.1 Asp23/Gls24 family envelope stress response protein [Cohnella lubricantis]MBP2116990.1 putative alkaline shock family protein YloU [Cohnella lubricantis]